MLIPGMCVKCGGRDPLCEKCGGTGKVAFTLPDSGPAFTRECPVCGWTNGCYFPQPGMFMPVDGEPMRDADRDSAVSSRASNFCMQCRDQDGHPKHGHMIWRKLS